MTNVSVADIKRINRDELAELVRSKDPGLAVVDVRDSDFIGGHILNCQNVPTNTHDYRMPELIRTLKDKNTVVFHCALSQQRGPSSALRYLREREHIQERSELGQRGDGQDVKQAQKVYVLDGGFTKWQEKYGEDKDLTEAYQKDLWEFGY